jgi:TolB-like protein
MCRFLRFAVEHALSKTGDKVKEYLVGVEVFDRGNDFDPQVDPIVRVEVRRLRAKLEAYYESIGRNDVLRFEFPKGAYRAIFRVGRGTQRLKPTENGRATIALLPFAELSPESSDGCFSAGLSEELISLLTHIQGVRMVAWDVASRLQDGGPNLSSFRDGMNPGSFLRGSIRRAGTRIRVAVQWINAHSGAYMWSDVFERSVQDVLATQQELARAIADAVRSKLAPYRAAVPVARRRNAAFEIVRKIAPAGVSDDIGHCAIAQRTELEEV